MDPETTPQTTPEPATEPATPAVTFDDGFLLEALDTDGWRWRIQVITAGVSANGNEYPLAMLHEAAALYGGVPVHEEHSERPRTMPERVGYVTEARANATGVEGTFEVRKSRADVRDDLMQAWVIRQKTGRDLFGFSHVLSMQDITSEARQPRGRRVTKIRRVSAVDLVASPAAGGAFLSPLSESSPASDSGSFVPDVLQEAIMTVAEMLDKLKSGKKLGTDELARLAESISPEELAEALGTRAATAAPATEPVTETVPEPVSNDAVTEAEKAVNAALERIRLQECTLTLAAKLAESNLPELFRARIRKDFEGKLFEAADLDARISDDRDLAAKLVQERPTLPSLTVTQDQREKHQKAMDGLVWGRAQDGIKPFLTLKEAYMAITGDNRYSYIDGNLPRRILAEAIAYAGDDALLQESITTSTFGDVLGDSIRRRMLQEYGRPDRMTWRNIVNVTPVVDFRTVERTRWGGYGLLPTVAQGAPYQSLTSPGDEKATDSLDKYGGLEDLTMETIANDDMGVVRRIPVKMGYAAVDTLYNEVFNDTIVSNAVASYDSVALFDAAHANTGTAALDEAGLSAVRVAMRDQAEFGNQSGLPLGEANTPRILLVPNELEVTAFKLTQSAVAVTSGSDATLPNFFNNAFQVIVVDDWTDVNNWYAFADPSLSAVLEVGFFQGREEPELFVQDAQTVGSMFNADKVTYKIRHIWYVMIVDHRGAYRQVVT